MKSDLPNSSQFSPVQTPLPQLLAIVKKHQPDRLAVTQAILMTFFSERVGKTDWDLKLADNTVLAMSQYRLVKKPIEDTSYVTLTEFGESLYLLSLSDDTTLYQEFAKHILLNLRGLDLVECISDLWASGKKPTKHLIIKELRHRNIYHPPNGTHANGMRQWLEKAGIIDGDWVLDTNLLDQLMGITSEELHVLAGLTREQRDFAKAFARLNVPEAFSNKVAQYATTLFGTDFPEGGLPQSVLFALRDAGLIECVKTTTGQGAKPYMVYPTDMLKNDLIEPLLNSIENSVGLQYRTLIRMKYEDILAGLDSKMVHEKGLALEALAFYLARVLDLTFVQWRLRTAKTGGAELDVVMESDRLIFSRWQIQCKNSKQATLEDIAKEVGLAQVIKANIILIVCTGKIGAAASEFARQVMKDTNLYVALLEGKHLQQIKLNPAEIVTLLNEQAGNAMSLKRDQVQLPSA